MDDEESNSERNGVVIVPVVKLTRHGPAVFSGASASAPFLLSCLALSPHIHARAFSLSLSLSLSTCLARKANRGCVAKRV